MTAEDFTVVYIISFSHSYNTTHTDTHTHTGELRTSAAHLGYLDLSEHRHSRSRLPEMVEVD